MAARPSGTRTQGMPCGAQAASSSTTAAAPDWTAAGMKPWPSTAAPRSAKKSQPGSTLRESQVNPAGALRADPIVDAMGGFIDLTIDRLARIEVKHGAYADGSDVTEILNSDGDTATYPARPSRDYNQLSVRYDLAYERTRAGLAELAADAERLGEWILVENIWNKFLLSPLEVRRLVDEIGSARVGVLLDTGNVLAFGYPEQWIRILGSRIKKIHFKDFKIDHRERRYEWTQLMQGSVDWPAAPRTIEPHP